MERRVSWHDLDAIFEAARARWGGNGPGSTAAKTKTLLDSLTAFVVDNGITSMLDLGCGTYGWLHPMVKEHFANFNSYIGVDVVSSVIDENRRKYPGLRFEVLDERPLPCADMVFCRDVMQHLTQSQNRRLMAKIRHSRSELLVATSHRDQCSWPLRVAGGCRPVNLELRPYDLGPPVMRLADEGKSVGVWRLR
jgi:SAM-dependent methyltransferase